MYFILHDKLIFNENIEQEWAYICANVNIDNKLENINVSSNSGTKRTYKDYYTTELKNKVAVRYQKDIEMFGYDF